MNDYEKLKDICDVFVDDASEWIHGFIITYALRFDKLGRELDLRFKRYSHILSLLPQSGEFAMRNQYVMHRIFRREGIIRKLVNHTEVKSMGPEALAYFAKQKDTPWQFVFTTIIEKVAPDFYRHKNVFTGEEYLVYSTGMSLTLQEYNDEAAMWMTLLGFNGSCWQSFGPITAFRKLTADDVFFFATELDENVASDADVQALIEKDPTPFMMLVVQSKTPAMVHRGNELVAHRAVVDIGDVSVEALLKGLHGDRIGDVIRLSFPEWSGPMHYGHAYLDLQAAECFCFALTGAAFSAIREALKRYDIGVGPPDLLLTVPAVLAMQEILGRKVSVDDYSAMFKPLQYSEETVTKLQKQTRVLTLATEDRAKGLNIDPLRYAELVSLPLDDVNDMLDSDLGHVNRLMDRI